MNKDDLLKYLDKQYQFLLGLEATELEINNFKRTDKSKELFAQATYTSTVIKKIRKEPLKLIEDE